MSLGKRISRRSQKKPLFYGWIMVAVMTAVGSLSMALGTLNFGLFIRPMGDELGIGRGVFGLAQTARMTAAAVTSPIVGRLIDQIGSRLLVPLAAFITGAALMAVANISQGWQLVMLFALMGIIGIGGPSNLTTTVPIAKIKQQKEAQTIVNTIANATNIFGYETVSTAYDLEYYAKKYVTESSECWNGARGGRVS